LAGGLLGWESALNKPVYIIGDTHGFFGELYEKLDQYEIKDCTLIHVGDGGEGFVKPQAKQLRQYKHLNDFFKKREISYKSIRGNHSDPAQFDGSIKLSNFELLPDYHSEIINGEKFLFVGGAVSVDRKIRREGVSYWRDEAFVLDESKAQKCDVLITHSAPNWIGPEDFSNISGWIAKDVHLPDELTEERRLHDRLYQICQPSRAYAGHFHATYCVDFDDCHANILNILEIREHHPRKRNEN